MIKIKLINDDITKIDVEAIVNPANSYGYMGGGVAGAILKEGGEEIEQEAVGKAMIPIGECVVTTAGNLKAQLILHTPTMEQPAGKTCKDYIKEAVRAALNCAVENNVKRLAMPGMGTGIGELSLKESAEAIAEELVEFKDSGIDTILIVDIKLEFLKEVEKVFKEKKLL